MGALVSLITSRLAGPVASGVAILLLVFGLVQCAEKRHETARADKAEATRKLAEAGLKACQTNRQALEASLATQSAAVDALKRASEARVAQSAKAVSAARAVAEGAHRHAAALMAEKPKGDLCEAADALILKEAGA